MTQEYFWATTPVTGSGSRIRKVCYLYCRSCFAQAALPAVIFAAICYMPLKQETQIFAAGVMGTYYAIQMMVVIVGMPEFPFNVVVRLACLT